MRTRPARAIARAFTLPPLTRPALRDALLAGLGGTLAIGTLALLGVAAHALLIVAPFGATCVLLFAAPASPFAQPRNVIAGHVISAIVGLVVVATLGPSPFAMAIGVGLAIAAMRLTGTLHPPAGANPIVVALSAAPWWFFAVPVALGAAILVVVAVIYHRAVSQLAYPTAS